MSKIIIWEVITSGKIIWRTRVFKKEEEEEEEIIIKWEDSSREAHYSCQGMQGKRG